MRRAQPYLMSTCGAVLMLGCSQPAMKDDPNNITIDKAPLEMARTICLRAYDCCTPMQLMPNMSAGTDEATCETESTTMFRNQLSAVANAQKQGRLVFHGDKLAACLTRIRSASCQDLNRTNHLSGIDCGEPYLEPAVAPGGACTLESECIAGTCVKPEGAAEGTCVARGRLHQSCANGVRCGDGLYCDDANQLCKPTRTDGTTCSAPQQCTSGNCDTSAGLPSCAPPVANMCFYSSACSAAGNVTPSITGMFLGLFSLAWAVRRRARTRPLRRLR